MRVPWIPAGEKLVYPTADGGAYTVGVLIHLLHDGRCAIGDERRGRWSALEREKVIKSTAEIDKQAFPHHFVWVEQEPGSSGKESEAAPRRHTAPGSGFIGDR
jgi:hypothetical protein